MDRGTTWLLSFWFAIGVVLWLCQVPWAHIAVIEVIVIVAMAATPLGGIITVFMVASLNGWTYDDGSPDQPPPILDGKFIVFWALLVIAVGIKTLMVGQMEFLAFLLILLAVAFGGMAVIMARQRTSRAGDQ